VDRPAFAEMKSDEDRVAVLYLAIYQRMPTKQEVALGLRFVEANPAGADVIMAVDQRPANVKAREVRKRMAKQGPNARGRFNPQVGGIYENRMPLDAWTKLAHALFQTNEAMFYN